MVQTKIRMKIDNASSIVDCGLILHYVAKRLNGEPFDFVLKDRQGRFLD